MEWFNEHKALIILFSLGYCLIGVWSLKWTCMGLIGYHNDPKGFWMLLVFIFLWWIPVGYIGWLCIAGLANHKLSPRQRLEYTHPEILKEKTIYTCEGKGGEYILIGIATDISGYDKSFFKAAYHSLSIGAGNCKDERLSIYKGALDGAYYYTGLTSDSGNRVIYQDTYTGKHYHRSMPDFRNRMKRIR